MVRVVTDSTADIPPQMVEELGITVVPCRVVFGFVTYLDGIDLTRQQFYDKLINGRMIPTTASPPISAYEDAFTRLAGTTDEIISLQMLSSLGGNYNWAVMAAEQVNKVTGVRINVVDTGQLSMGIGWMAVEAAEAAMRGESLDQVAAHVEAMKPRSCVMAILDTLEYVYRGGRTNWAAAMLGTLLNVKPIAGVRFGKVELFERTRTIKRSLERLVERIEALGKLERAVVLHTNAPALAARLASQLQAIYPEWEPMIEQAGVTIASHLGPGAVGIAVLTAG